MSARVCVDNTAHTHHAQAGLLVKELEEMEEALQRDPSVGYELRKYMSRAEEAGRR